MGRQSEQIDCRSAAAGPSTGPRTLRRGLRILEVLRNAGPSGMTARQIAQAAGVQRPTVYRFLDVLTEEGYAVRDEDTRRYGIARQWTSRRDAYDEAVDKFRPALRRISDETGDSVFLICRTGSESLCLHREVGSYPVQVHAVTVGHRQPLGVGAAGLALLAALPPDEASALIEQNARALSAYGNMTAARMQVLVESTRVRGWSVVAAAAVPGVLGVGTPVLDATGYPVLAASVSSVIDRMPAKRQRGIVKVMRRELARVAL